MGNVASLDYDGFQLRVVEKDSGELWYVAADICRCVELAINSRTGKPNVTVATRELTSSQKEKFRVETPENPKNPWIDMMIVSELGVIRMLSASDSEEARRLKAFITSDSGNISQKAGVKKSVAYAQLLD